MAKRRIKRRINVPGRETPAERQKRTAVNFIMSNQSYPAILNAIRSGTPNTDIAEWGIARGIFTGVNQKTVVGYLQYFRKAQPELCRPKEPDPEKDEFGYDHLFNGNEIVINEETEMLRLIKLQQARLGIAFNNERELGMLLASNRRDVEELRNLLIDLAKLRGKMRTTQDVNLIGYSEGVKDDLRGIRQDEQQRNMIATLVSDLVKVSDG